jgi:hypothetical protein
MAEYWGKPGRMLDEKDSRKFMPNTGRKYWTEGSVVCCGFDFFSGSGSASDFNLNFGSGLFMKNTF